MLRSIFLLAACCVVLCVGKDQIPTRCGRNEEVQCVNICPPEKTCRTRDIAFSCLYEDKPCQHKCICKEGYFRNSLGDCITGEECNKCTGSNEFFACDSACDNECSLMFKQNRTNCPIKNIVCNPKCYCDDGFARDTEGNCIPQEKCPPIPTCKGINEEYTNCKVGCPPDTCITTVLALPCLYQPCAPGCTCKPGFLREDGESPCMPRCECPQIKNSPPCIEN